MVALLEAVFPKVGTEVQDATEARRILAAAPLAAVAPPACARVEEMTVPGAAGLLPARGYWPVDDASGLPVIAFFHGGGWVLCDLETHDGLCRQLANGAGAIVMSVDYRLAPEHRFPAAAEDAYAATGWLHEHASEIGGDATRLVVAGDSAGGNLCAVVTLMARDRGGPPLAAQLLLYPVLDHKFDTSSYRENAEGYFLTTAQMRWYWKQYLGPDGDGASPYASPLRAPDLRGLPPAWIVVAGNDPLRDEGLAYGRRLEEAGVQTAVRCYDGMFHGFFSMGEFLEGARTASSEAFGALRAAFSGSPWPAP